MAEGKIKPLVHFSDSQVHRNEYTPRNEKNGGSVVKSTRRSVSSAQWLATVTPAGGDLMTSSGMHGEHAVKTYIQARYSYISNNFYKKIN